MGIYDRLIGEAGELMQKQANGQRVANGVLINQLWRALKQASTIIESLETKIYDMEEAEPYDMQGIRTQVLDLQCAIGDLWTDVREREEEVNAQANSGH